MNWIDVLVELNKEAILFDNLDAAIVGTVNMDVNEDTNEEVLPRVVALYSYEKLVEIMAESIKNDEMYKTTEEVMDAAVDYVEYNCCGFWYGPNTPVILSVENRYAVREQRETLQEGIPATDSTGGEPLEDGAPEGS